ncbi:hypothetical protein [Streptomyces caatingaensis]|uniref:Uncharacterized protein n=1 Tax=Streptomyces caatingaensis TaxID=1678637 RepID=A0A0K9XES6_9ACTN|nr:hypothetical protein [Streptomyces caatingaensis]KNB51713.1 hypothetical protein AC230_15395 [Streptomyces caatingaensis]
MGFLYAAFFGAFLYLLFAIPLCRKVARRTTPRMGWTMAFLLIGFPAILLVVGGLIDAGRNAP